MSDLKPSVDAAMEGADLSTLDEYDNEANWLDDVLCAGMPPDADDDVPLSVLERKLSRLLSLLQATTADTAQTVDQSIDDIARGVPRLAFDLQLMRENTLLLKYSLDSIRLQGASVTSRDQSGNDAADSVLDQLKFLDVVKGRMEASRAVLREAESWSTLESDVTGFLTDNPPLFHKAAERLAEAQRSMVVFQHTQEFEGRRGLMRSLQNELEAGLSSSLVRAIGDRDVKACKEYFNIFGMIDREGEFRNYYFGTRRNDILKLWSSAKLSDCASQPPTYENDLEDRQTLASFLKETFYPALLLLLTSELTHLPAIFPDPFATLSSFVTTIIDNLQPSFSSRLTELSERGVSLPALTLCWEATRSFGLDIESIFHKLSAFLSLDGLVSSPGSTTPNGATREATSPVMWNTARKDRRSSKRMSMSRRVNNRRYSISGLSPMLEEGSQEGGQGGNVSHDEVKEWETALYEPFLDFQSDFQTLEKIYLASTTASIKQSVLERPNRQQVGDGLATLLTIVEESLGRCMTFTLGYAMPSCLRAIDQTLEDYINRVRLNRSKESMNLMEERRRLENERSANNVDVQLDGFDYTTKDWENFQDGLRYLGSCRTLSERVEAFESSMNERLLTLVLQLRDPAYLPQGVTQGVRALMKQSTLNSAELLLLMDRFSPPTLHHALQRKVSGASSSAGEGVDVSSASATSNPTTPSLRAGHHKTLSISASLSLHLPTKTEQHRQQVLLPVTHSSLKTLTKTCQLAVHTTILAPLKAHLISYPNLSVWNASAAEIKAATSSSAAYDMQMPNFSLSPTESITRVGEGLFNLPRLFEVYAADDDALAFSIETLPYVNPEALLRSLGGATSGGHPHDVLLSPNTALKTPKSDVSTFLDPSDSNSQQQQQHSNTRSRAASDVRAANVFTNLSAESVISTWLSSLTLTVVSHLTNDVLPLIPQISSHGATQMSSDLTYISNVAKALDAESDELDRWQEICEMDSVEWKRQFEELDDSDVTLLRFGSARGWYRGQNGSEMTNKNVNKS